MSSTALANRAAIRTPVGTPQKPSPAPASTDSPGNWKHPRLAEITKRQNATMFGEKNIRIIIYNVLALIMVIVVRSSSTVQKHTQKYPAAIRGYIWWLYLGLHLLPLINIGIALMPLFRAKDDISDIPLTAAQRKLLGLPPSSAPATPGSVYSTPPRYSRTPSISGSVGSNKSFAASSPLSGKGSGSPAPLAAGRKFVGGSGSPFSPGGAGGAGSPLFQKAINGGRKSSFGGSPGPLLAERSATPAAPNSLFPDSPAANGPSPSGKRTSVGLNSKWLYEKGRKGSGNTWLQ